MSSAAKLHNILNSIEHLLPLNMCLCMYRECETHVEHTLVKQVILLDKVSEIKCRGIHIEFPYQSAIMISTENMK